MNRYVSSHSHEAVGGTTYRNYGTGTVGRGRKGPHSVTEHHIWDGTGGETHSSVYGDVAYSSSMTTGHYLNTTATYDVGEYPIRSH